jgi:hypothetical protein
MRALVPLAALALVLAPGRARAEDLQKIAVLIVGATPADAEVADNLTEVVIARVAQTRGVQIAGTAEFRKRLGIQSENRARLCLEDAACIATIAVSLGVTKIVSGSVAARDNQFLFSLILRDMNTGEIEKRIFRLVDGDVDELVAAAQQATSELFVAPPAPGRVHVGSEPAGARVSIDEAYVGTTPLISGNLVAGKHALRVEAAGHFPWSSNVVVPAGSNFEINLTPQNLPPRLQWPTTVATGLTALAVATAATGAVLGVLAQVEPTSPNRAVAQEEFEHRRRLGLAADVTFVGAMVVGAAAGVVFWVYRGHIFGGAGPSRPGSPPGLD